MFSDPDSSQLVQAAQKIGERLCETARWDPEHRVCHWKGTDVIDPSDNVLQTAVQDLGGDLYGGSAGIAFFLSHMGQICADESMRETAVGGLRHATNWMMDRAGALPALSVFSGPLGAVYAAQRGAIAIDKGSSAMKLVDVVRWRFQQAPATHTLDVVTGASGAIPLLLELHRSTGQSTYLDFACALGRDICARADWTGEFCNWDTNEAAKFDAPPLTGLSHGVSGIAYALLRLHEAVEDPAFLTTARGAYAYEDTQFDAVQGNWLDLRDGQFDGNRNRHIPVYWCHGAAGILLSRAAAMRLDPARADRHRDAVSVAAATTQTALTSALQDKEHDTTICHGTAGLLEALQVAAMALNDQDLNTVAVDGGLALLKLHETGQDWPSGVFGGGANPSLMVGDAGIGYTFLRLALPAVLPAVTLVS